MDVAHRRFWNYWGKAKPAESGASFHRLVYHSIDVAAVGMAFLEQSPVLLNTFCARLQCSREAFLSWSGFFLALHDLGKFSDSFQCLRTDLVRELQGRDGNERAYTERHDTLGFWIWREDADTYLEAIGMDANPDDIHCWMRAVCGHHGMPPVDNGQVDRHFSRANGDAVADFINAMADLLLTDEARAIPAIAGVDFEEASCSLSWWFAGLAVLADWLGSNTDFFPYRADACDLRNYLVEARAAVQRVLADSGVSTVPIAPGKTMEDFFPYIQNASPLQAWARDVALEREPQLFLLEDVTGAGKTEAAVLLAYRLMEAGVAQGFFVGLPTMATANAMYGRIANVYQELFAEAASLTLGHGFKDLVERFTESIRYSGESESDPAQKDDTASERCTAWLADHNKRALLAPAGVGTIDQGLLAVLHSKHQSLRLLGLFNKVLIIDEVHACDAYMEAVLKVLLRFHASMGGSAILLSATLPNRMKQGLVDAYAQGRGLRALGQALEAGYPLATRWSSAGLRQERIASRENVSRTVQVRYESDDELLIRDAVEALAQDKCVGWICNTVADAGALYERFAGSIGRDRITLFHARFAMGDRLQTEEMILRHFGSESGPQERKGRLMIATQVAEQSLDVDFDVLVTDLAPIDRLLQRAGRTQRHVRDARGQRLTGRDAVDGRSAPSLWVRAPAWTNAPQSGWYGDKFDKAQYVYPRHDQLWLTARALQRGQFSMPADARDLVEQVYSGDQDVPETLQVAADKREGIVMAEVSQAQMNSLRFNGGYQRGEIGDWWADTRTPSRLGEETTEVMLAKWVDGRLQPWQERPWPYSMVKVAAHAMAKGEVSGNTLLADEYARLRLTLPMEGKYCVLLALEQRSDDVWEGQAWTTGDEPKKRPPRLHTWRYDAEIGLRRVGSGASEEAPD